MRKVRDAHVAVGPVTLGNDLPFVLIAGPCQIESREHALETAAALVEMCAARGLGLIYKSSFDKANRTSAEQRRAASAWPRASRCWPRCASASAARC